MRAPSKFLKSAVKCRQWLVVCGIILMTHGVYANPELHQVVSGDVAVSQSDSTLQVQQNSDKAIIEWKSFNINANETTHFQQPSASSIALNRIDPRQGASEIFGRLSANGQLILVNQAGIYFRSGAHVDVAGLVASTANISNEHFLSGHYIFDQPSPYVDARVVNEATIHALDHGLIALIGMNVDNQGNLQANLGSVVLASGNKFTVDFLGDGLVNFAVDEATAQPHVNHTGTVIANGGTVILSAEAASHVVDEVINMSGIVQAQSVEEKSGKIILLGGEGDVVVSGDIDASSIGVQQHGGTVEILGKNIHLLAPTQIDVRGDQGGGMILVGGAFQGQGPQLNAWNTTVDAGVNLLADATLYGSGGQVVVWSDNATQFHGNIFARGGAMSGDGGSVETSGHLLNIAQATVDTSAAHGNTGMWLLDPSDLTIDNNPTTATVGVNTYSNNASNSSLNVTDLTTALANNNITVQTTNTGSGGNGDIIVSVPISWSSSNTLTLNAFNKIYLDADITATNGGLILSAANSSQSITSSVGSAGVTANISVANFNLSQGQWYQLNSSLPTFSVTNNFQIASGATAPTNVEFFRVKSGLGTSLSPYVLQDVYGLQGINSSTTLLGNNFRLSNNIDASSTSNWNSGSGFVPIGNTTTVFTGGFDGNNFKIDGLYINRSSYDYAGLMGIASLGSNSIENLGVTNLNVTGGQNVAGIAAIFGGGTITNSYTTGTVTQSTATSSFGAGGFVGQMSGGSISNSYSTATVTGIGSIGGLVGFQDNSSISNSFATGKISGSSLVGGLIGFIASAGVVSDSYSTGSVIATTADVGGLVGFTSAGSGAITNSFSTGYVSPVTNSGGLIGRADNASVASNSFYDTTTTGRNVSGSGTGLTTTQLQSALQSGFSASTWGIISGQSYPYLKAIFTSTPRAISGTSNLGSDVAVTMAVNGANAGSAAQSFATASTGANGYYYFLQGNGIVNDSDAIIVYRASGGSANAVTVAPSSGGSITGLTVTSNAINIGDSSNPTVSNTSLSTAKGALTTGILYSASGNNLTLTSGINFNTLGSTTYNLNGNIAASGSGALTFNGAVSLGGSSTLSTANSGITFGSTLNGGSALTIADSSGPIIFSGVIGGTTPLSSLTIGSSDATTLNTNSVTTTGTQTYNSVLTLTAHTTLTGSVAFGSSITDGGFNLSAVGSGSSTLSLLSGTPTWNITGSNSGSIANVLGTGAFTFSNFANLTGGSGNDTFAFNSTSASISGTVDGSAGTNTLSYTGLGAPVAITLTGDTSGSVRYNGSLITTFANVGNTNAVSTSLQNTSTLTLPNRTNTVTITGYGTGFAPFNYNGIFSVIGAGTTSVVFNIPAAVNMLTGVATLNGDSSQLIQFSNVQDYSGSVSTNNGGAMVENAIVTVGVQASEAAANSSVADSPAATTSKLMLQMTTVNDNLNQISNDQQTLNMDALNNMQISGCGAP